MSLRDWPIRQKLTAMLVLSSGLVLLLTSAALVGYQYWSFRQTMRSTLSVRGSILATNSTASLAFANDADARELLSALRADPHIVAAALYDRNGRLFATYPGDLPGGALPAAPGPDGYRFQRGNLIGFQPVAEAGGQRLGTLYLASDLAAVDATLRLSGVIAVAVLTVVLAEFQDETSTELAAALAERDSVAAEYMARSAVSPAQVAKAMRSAWSQCSRLSRFSS